MEVAKQPGQMSLDLGRHDGWPIVGSLKISGPVGLEDELYKGDKVVVTGADADGAVVMSAFGRVVGIAFTDHDETARKPAYTERKHTVKFDE